jgi:hypothetical protein
VDSDYADSDTETVRRRRSGAEGLQQSEENVGGGKGKVVMRGYMKKRCGGTILGQRRWIKRFYELETSDGMGGTEEGLLKYARRDDGAKTVFKSSVLLTQSGNRLQVCSFW